MAVTLLLLPQLGLTKNKIKVGVLHSLLGRWRLMKPH